MKRTHTHTHAHTHARTHAPTHTRARARARTRTNTQEAGQREITNGRTKKIKSDTRRTACVSSLLFTCHVRQSGKEINQSRKLAKHQSANKWKGDRGHKQTRRKRITDILGSLCRPHCPVSDVHSPPPVPPLPALPRAHDLPPPTPAPSTPPPPTLHPQRIKGTGLRKTVQDVFRWSLFTHNYFTHSLTR